jgi:hypothetical protein
VGEVLAVIFKALYRLLLIDRKAQAGNHQILVFKMD